MAKKIKDLILAFNENINSNELATLAGASGLADIEVSDNTIEEIKTKLGALMSKEAAQNNPVLEDHFKKKLYPVIKGELLGNIDTDLYKNAKSLFGDDIENEFKDIEFTSDKIKKFTELTKTLIEKGSGDTKLKEVNSGLKKQIKELSESFNKDISKKDKEIKNINSGFNDLLIKKEFTSKMSSYNLGEKYNEDFVKKALFEDIFYKVQKQAKLTLSENGSIIPKNPENVELELFVNNKKIEDVKDIIDPLMQSYIVKKSGKPGEQSVYKPTDKTAKMSTLAIDMHNRKKQTNMI